MDRRDTLTLLIFAALFAAALALRFMGYGTLEGFSR
jgi:hypothetical protein